MLTGQAKREYQRTHQKAYRLRHKGSNQGLITRSNQDDVKTLLEAQGLTLEGNRIVGTAKQAVVSSESVTVPLYNPSVHKPGARVLVRPPYGKREIEIVIPEIDADGHPVPEYT